MLSVANCDLSANNGISKKYDCPVALQFFADATDVSGRYPSDNWQAWIQVTDNSSSSTVASTTKEIASILSANVPGSVGYGTMGLGQKTSSSTNQEMVITQKGNSLADVELSGSDMVCSRIGSIPSGNQKWALTDIGYDDGGTSLTSSLTQTSLDMGYRDGDALDVTKTIYWNLAIPLSGVGGTCSGTTTVTVINQM